MGVLNVTPDSFSDGGRWPSVGAAVAHAERMLADGASIIDVGGESTRPGASPVSEREELRRVIPVVEALVGRCTLSVDTRKPAVARRCAELGVDIINDVSGSLWPICAEFGVGWVVMHMRGNPETMQADPRYHNVVDEVVEFLAKRAATARAAGVGDVWIDPGIGFGKSLDHNLALLRGIDQLTTLGYPVLMGVSRKTFIHQISGAPDAQDRLGGSLAAALHAAIAGVEILRVHDVPESIQALRVMEAIHPRSRAYLEALYQASVLD